MRWIKPDNDGTRWVIRLWFKKWVITFTLTLWLVLLIWVYRTGFRDGYDVRVLDEINAEKRIRIELEDQAWKELFWQYDNRLRERNHDMPA